jgi:hypothetical protein
MKISMSKSTDDGDYALRVPLIRTGDGKPLEVPMKRPTGHYLIFLVGLANLVRLLVEKIAPDAKLTTVAAMYLGSSAIAGIAAHYANGARSEQTSRFASANVGLINFVLGMVNNNNGLLVPCGGVALAMVPSFVGEVLYRRRADHDPAAGQLETAPPVPAHVP